MSLSSTLDCLTPASGAHALPSIRETMVRLLAKQMHLSPAQVQTDRPFTEYGLDSIAALTISGELEDQYGIELPPTLLWDYPTVDALASYLADGLGGR